MGQKRGILKTEEDSFKKTPILRKARVRECASWSDKVWGTKSNPSGQGKAKSSLITSEKRSKRGKSKEGGEEREESSEGKGLQQRHKRREKKWGQNRINCEDKADIPQKVGVGRKKEGYTPLKEKQPTGDLKKKPSRKVNRGLC